MTQQIKLNAINKRQFEKLIKDNCAGNYRSRKDVDMWDRETLVYMGDSGLLGEWTNGEGWINPKTLLDPNPIDLFKIQELA